MKTLELILLYSALTAFILSLAYVIPQKQLASLSKNIVEKSALVEAKVFLDLTHLDADYLTKPKNMSFPGIQYRNSTLYLNNYTEKTIMKKEKQWFK